ncbi:MAG: 2-succinyl-6-hydroxy-2,4-cyclohexadiene-1-carboxylate synthase [Chloroflexota bacterium]
MTAVDVDGLRWEVRTRGTGTPLLLFHGFTGRGTAWGAHAAALARDHRVVVVDLPGHGRSATPRDPRRASVERSADDLATILDRLSAAPADVLGYSLGARIALRLAVAHSDHVRRLVLESPSAGIADPVARAERAAADEARATRLERDGIEAFVLEWEREPVFASHAVMDPARRARLRAGRLRNTPEGLAASLRGAGQGGMEPLHDALPDIHARTLLIAGALDRAGCARASEIAACIPRARLAIIENAGHTPHLEAPKTFRRLVTDFLEEDNVA